MTVTETSPADEQADPAPRLKPSPRAVLAAEEIVGAWRRSGGSTPVDRLFAEEIRQRRGLNSGERRWLAAAVFGVVRHFRRQVAIAEALGLEPDPRNLIGAWIAQSDVDLAARLSHEAFAQIAKARAALPTESTPHDYLRTTLSFPDLMADALEATLGLPEAVDAAAAFNESAPFTLRVNTLRTTVTEALKEIGGSPGRYSPLAVTLPKRIDLNTIPQYDAGWFDVQEEASQLAAFAADAMPGQLVVDVGAGAGGKTLALAAMMKNRGTLVAIDTDRDRLEELERRARRALARISGTIHVVAGNRGGWRATRGQGDLLERVLGQAHSVLIDAPCSGSGILRRSPDLKWRRQDTQAITCSQFAMIKRGAELVAPGGYLTYVTCAFQTLENEFVVERFLKSEEGAEFAPVPAAERISAAIERVADKPAAIRFHDRIGLNRSSSPFLRTWPHRHGMDAFFIACLRRRQTARG